MIGTINKVNKVGTLIMDLSQTFDKLNHNLIICKLKAYGFNKYALTLSQTYSKDKNKQKLEISLANDKRSSQACLKVPFLALYFSAFSSTISFFLLKLLHYATILMTIICILWIKIRILSVSF